jgi:dihydroorotate dehydrogenase (fumarate)
MDLSTKYLGLPLNNPIVASASPLSKTLDGIRRLEDAGAAAVVMYSLFEEQIEHDSLQLDHFLSTTTDLHAEAASYFPDLGNYNIGPDAYLDLIAQAKRVTNIPIIGSLNGTSTGGWVEQAQLIEQAGADALELNVYHLATSLQATGAEVEARTIDVVRAVRGEINIPLAVKLGPFFSSIPNLCAQLVDNGVNGLVLFNRFYQPDFDIEALEVVPRVTLSNSEDLRLPLRWVAILYGRLAVDFAITTGVHTHEDVVKGMMAGANVTMMASELLHNGVGRIEEVLGNLTLWLKDHEYESLAQMRGSMSQMKVADPGAFERANYMKVLQSWRVDDRAAATRR